MFFIVNAYGQKETWCASNSMGYTQSDVTDGKGGWLCLFQSLWISFFAFAAFNWWFCQVVDLYLRVHLSKRNVDHYLKYYHAFSWGVPAICTIVLLASGTLGYAAPRTWCYLKAGTDNWVVWVVLYMFITFYLVVGIPMMIAVVSTILKTTSAATSSKSSAKKKFRYVKMPLFFATIFLVIAFSMLSYVIKGQVNTTDIRNGAKEWVQCLAFNFLRGMKNPAVNASAIIPPKLQALGVVPGSGCGVRYPVRLSTFLTHMAQGCVLGQAILVALVFGHSRQNWLLWQRKLGCGRGMKDSDRTASMATTTSGGMHKLSSTKSLLSKMSLSKMSLPKKMSWMFGSKAKEEKAVGLSPPTLWIPGRRQEALPCLQMSRSK